MIRMGDYKLIVYPYAGVKRLFNLEDDPMEMNDLAANPDQQERMDTMLESLQAKMMEMGDTLQLKSFAFDI